MNSVVTSMSPLAFAVVNVPLSAVTILMNVFFACCMFSPQEGPEKKQSTLNLLLWSLIGCNLILNVFNLFFVMFDSVDVPPWMYNLSAAVILYAMRTSFTSSLGLNVFYYFQIIPTRRPCLIWVKTHIRVFMYLMLFSDRIFFLFGFFLYVLPSRVFESAVDLNSSSVYLNFTSKDLHLQYYLILADFWLRCGYFLCCLGIMLVSNTATVLYLRRHARNMEKNCRSFSALHQQKQLRVTVTSAIQTVLFFLSAGWLIAEELMYRFDVYFDLDGHILCTVLGFYSLGTTIILGVGQSKFRLRVTEIGKNIRQAFSKSNRNVGHRNRLFNCQLFCQVFCCNNTEEGQVTLYVQNTERQTAVIEMM